ncbi:MAG TPA: protein kinase [Abditibacteriaceae bacterium]
MRTVSPRGKGSATRNRWDSAGSRYEVLERVGEGTLFVVYRVRDRSNNRVMALKALKGAFNRHPRFASTLTACVDRMAKLSHPNLARLWEVGEEEGTLFLVTEWLPGQNLEQRLRRAPFGRAEALSFTRQIAEALHYLHQNGAVHGDLRPRHVGAAADGSLKLTDAGLYESFVAAGLAPMDVMEEAVYYTAPERTEGAAPAPASDLYALGVILYRMLAGRVPFDGPSPLSIALRHRKDAPLRPSQFNPDCPPDLEDVAMRLLEKDPQARYASAGQLLRDLAVGPAASRPARNDTASAAASTQVASAPQPNGNGAAPSHSITPPQTPGVGAAANVVATGVSAAGAVAAGTIAAGATAAGATAAGAVAAGTVPAAALVAGGVATGVATAGTAAATAASAAPVAAVTAAGAAGATSTGAISAGATAAGATTTTTPLSTSPIVPVANTARTTPPARTARVPQGGYDDTQALATHDADDTAFRDDDERLARRAQRRREAIGALLAVFWLLVAIGLFAGIIYGAYYFWKKETPREVRVPNYLSKSEYEARSLLNRAGLKMVIVGQVYDPKRPEGTVIKGQPAPKKLVRTGREVGVTVSRGQEPITMADLTELDLQRARQIIERGGMRIGNLATQYHDTIPRGYICGQFPEPGQSFQRNEPITLIVSLGPQLSDLSSEPAQLPPPPPRSSPTEDFAPSSPLSTQSTDTPEVALVSRTVHVRVAIPADGGSQEVRVVVRDSDGEHTVYSHMHAPGDLVDEDVQVTRRQGTTAIVRVYVDGTLLREQRV